MFLGNFKEEIYVQIQCTKKLSIFTESKNILPIIIDLNLQTLRSNETTMCSRFPTDFIKLVPVPY